MYIAGRKQWPRLHRITRVCPVHAFHTTFSKRNIIIPTPAFHPSPPHCSCTAHACMGMLHAYAKGKASLLCVTIHPHSKAYHQSQPCPCHHLALTQCSSPVTPGIVTSQRTGYTPVKSVYYSYRLNSGTPVSSDWRWPSDRTAPMKSA
jgi:hypothetical protein